MSSKLLKIILFVICAATTAFATPQIPDILVYEGKEYPIQTEFLHEYFTKFPERNPKPKEDGCSANWRGYRATFEMAQNKIYLRDIGINVCFGPTTSALKKVVPDGKPLFIGWVTDLIDSGYGDNQEDPYSLQSLDAFENYSFFQVENGMILEVRHFDNKGYKAFKKKQFEAYKKTKEYESRAKKTLEENQRMNMVDVDADILMWIFSYTKTFLVK